MFLRHVDIALGSLGELDTDFELGRRLRFLTGADTAAIHKQIGRTRQLLHGLRRSLRRKQCKTILSSLALFAGLAGPALWLLLPVLY